MRVFCVSAKPFSVLSDQQFDAFNRNPDRSIHIAGRWVWPTKQSGFFWWRKWISAAAASTRCEMSLEIRRFIGVASGVALWGAKGLDEEIFFDDIHHFLEGALLDASAPHEAFHLTDSR